MVCPPSGDVALNGFVEYDVATDRITRVKTLPMNPDTNPDRTTWVNDSRHHGMSMNPDGSKLCVAGTVDNYVTVVDRASLQEGPLVSAAKPYWATVSGDGQDCVISESAADRISAISFTTGERVTSVAVGDHPQRIRIGRVQQVRKTDTKSAGLPHMPTQAIRSTPPKRHKECGSLQ